MIHGPRTKFADEGLAMTFTFFRITREIFQFGTCQFNIIARNKKALFRENFSSWRFDSVKIFLAHHGHHTVQNIKKFEI